ncbi:MAG: phytanoyl-CoA dioxygenase family protein [Planctomycetota bacterium]|nr:phytanoyl-CoA dioxygenase family protein [Planctomycetota bacterium]
MPLTPAQVKRFRDEGYLILGQLASPDRVIRLRAAYDECVEKLRREGKFKNTRVASNDKGEELGVYQIRAAHLLHPAFDELVRDKALLDMVEQIIGPNIRLCLMQGLYKPPHRGAAVTWHQDDQYFKVDIADAVVSCWFAIDEATIGNGCMWVLPRHHRELMPHVPTVDKQGYELATVDEATAVACELPPGHAMFHHGLTPHQSLPNTTDRPRRAVAMHFMSGSARPLGDNRMAEPAENMPVVRGTGVKW